MPATARPVPAGTTVVADCGSWGLAWVVDGFGRLRQLALGPEALSAVAAVDPLWYPDAHPVWGGAELLRHPALRITHADGTLTTRLVVTDVQVDHDPGHTDDAGVGSSVEVGLRDPDDLGRLYVALHLRAYPEHDMVEQWVEVVHHQDGPITVHDADSVAPLLLVSPAAEIVHFGGSGWADEWRWQRQRLTPGTTLLDSLGGIQPHLQRSPMLLVEPDGPAAEDEGTVLGLSIQWPGNTRFALDVTPRAERTRPHELRLRAGLNPFGADYVLDPGAVFATPRVAWTWSTTGRHEISRRFHSWSRAAVLRDPERLRPIVVNNWEATFFDFDQERIVDLMDRTAALGADVFLLDDGWFGTTHPRNDDDAGLGDWDVNPDKLPGGIEGLSAAAAERGIRFGIWVEPEMVNPRSDLFEAHADWVIRDRHEPRQHRNQLALDLLRPEVRDFVAGVFDRTLGPNPAISYVKWDANRPVSDPGSTTLAADRQSNLWVDLADATISVMARVAGEHPDVELMLCASGGGRNDHASLRWFHEFWTSDNTDPVERVRMQWACSLFFPPAVMAAHVTRWGERPVEFGCAVALSGRFGFDLDLAALTDTDVAVCQRSVALARRTQVLVQQGELFRLHSPVDGNDRTRAALMSVSADRRRAVAFAYQLDDAPARGPLVLGGLDPELDYDVTVTDLTGEPEPVGRLSGTDLGTTGLDWPLTHACTARIWELTATMSSPSTPTTIGRTR